ncbi:Zinc finger CCHC-type protein [Dioscorea alata]|uniref:Zinc finger CCHC-type protein n=1 Tax=Dioscorea alata TaxID=55571 RepID=A0ACB7UZ19_DIOAL|nr:Zinc finger CCHC-type protein [Dioscorea alata]
MASSSSSAPTKKAGDNSRGRVGDNSSVKRQQSFSESSRGRSRAFGRFSRGQRQPGQRSNRESLQNVQCYRCKKYGHYQSHCWSAQDRNSNEASSSLNAPSSSKYGNLFMVHNWRGRGRSGGFRGRGKASDNSRGRAGDNSSVKRQQSFSESSKGGSRAFGRFSRGQRQPWWRSNRKSLQNV